MKLEDKDIKLEINDKGEISQIKYKNFNILHDGKKWWQKTYPMVWPVVGISKGFMVDGKEYKLPKHGFWKDMHWDVMYEKNSITQVATHMANKKYPFSIDIQNNIYLEDNKVIVKTIFSNIGDKDAYFHFGHHPAFNIDGETIIKTKENDPQQISLDGSLKKETVKMEKIVDMDFGVKYDTLVYKDFVGELQLITKDYIIDFHSSDFESMQIWKPKDAQFVCIEPWQGYNDPEYDAPSEAKDKLDIVTLLRGEVRTFEFSFSIKDRKKVH